MRRVAALQRLKFRGRIDFKSEPARERENRVEMALNYSDPIEFGRRLPPFSVHVAPAPQKCFSPRSPLARAHIRTNTQPPASIHFGILPQIPPCSVNNWPARSPPLFPIETQSNCGLWRFSVSSSESSFYFSETCDTSNTVFLTFQLDAGRTEAKSKLTLEFFFIY